MVAVCGKLGMSPQNYYARRKERRRKQVDSELVVALVRQERQVQPRIGTRKLHFMLKGQLDEAGVKVGRDRMFEILRDQDLLVEPKPARFPSTTDSGHCLPVFSNQIKALEVSAPNQVWVADLTYLRTLEGFVYLSLLTDKKSRKIVGYHCGDTLEARECVQALEMALKDLPPGVRPIHHSDEGIQYCCHLYVNRLQEEGLGISMTESNHCAENALAERMNGILKSEYGLGEEFKTKELVRRAVEQAIHIYNTRRPHTALGYKVPEAVHRQAA